MCTCKDIEFGSYEATIPVWYDDLKRVVGLDVCIALEVISLWKQGIVTIESCCGHNKTIGYIAVDECCNNKMIDLGYVEIPEHANCFYPKKLLNEVKRKDLLIAFLREQTRLKYITIYENDFDFAEKLLKAINTKVRIAH